jgi:hypothetical protein
VTPHIAVNGHLTKTGSAAKQPLTPARPVMPAMRSSQRCRKRIEEAFGWINTMAVHQKSRFRGAARVGFAFTVAATAYNLVRLPKLLAVPT